MCFSAGILLTALRMQGRSIQPVSLHDWLACLASAFEQKLLVHQQQQQQQRQ
jgi:hypothetical protein